jgi:predicted secreted protein
MATTEINGRDIIVLIDPAGGTSYKTVVALTSNTITNSVTSLDGSSKTGNVFVPGVKFQASISGEGFLVNQATGTPTNQGFAELYSLFTARTQFTIKFGKASPVTGDEIYTGTVYITKLEEVAADDTLTKFSVTFECANPPFTQTVTY